MRVCRWLYLQENQITNIENGAFRDLVSLERLKLNDNRLRTLHAGLFDGLGKLDELWIHNNPLTTLDAALFSTQNQHLVLLMSDADSDDSWRCGTLCWLKEEENTGAISFVHEGEEYKPCCVDVVWDSLQCCTWIQCNDILPFRLSRRNFWLSIFHSGQYLPALTKPKVQTLYFRNFNIAAQTTWCWACLVGAKSTVEISPHT